MTDLRSGHGGTESLGGELLWIEQPVALSGRVELAVSKLNQISQQFRITSSAAESGVCQQLRYTIFATHMERLSELASIYPNVKVCHFQVNVRDNRMDFKLVFLGYQTMLLKKLGTLQVKLWRRSLGGWNSTMCSIFQFERSIVLHNDCCA